LKKDFNYLASVEKYIQKVQESRSTLLYLTLGVLIVIKYFLSFYGESSVTSLFAYIIFLGLFTIFLFTFTQEGKDKRLLKTYAYVLFTMALLGIWSFVLINIINIPRYNWDFSLTKMTNGRITKDLFENHLLTFPYLTGTVLSGNNPFTFLGLKFHRICSYATEPLWGFLFISPAYFLLRYKGLIYNSFMSRVVSSSLVALYLLFTFSVTGLISFIITLILTFYLTKEKPNLRNLCLSLITLALLIISLFTLNEMNLPQLQSFSILKKFRLTSEPVQLMINFYIAPYINLFKIIRSSANLTTFELLNFAQAIILHIHIGFILIKSVNIIRFGEEKYIGSLVICYTLACMRGSILEIAYWPMHLFMIFLLCMNSNLSSKTSTYSG
jgi:uncharacterized membrane protein